MKGKDFTMTHVTWAWLHNSCFMFHASMVSHFRKLLTHITSTFTDELLEIISMQYNLLLYTYSVAVVALCLIQA